MKFLDNNKFVGFYKILRQAFGRYKWPIVGLTVLSFLNGFFDAVGISALIPIFSFVVKGQEHSDDFISKNAEKLFSYFHLIYTLKTLIIFISILLAAKVIALFLVNYISTKIAADYETKTRSNLFYATFNGTWPHLSKQKIGYLDQLLTNDVRNVSSLLIYISTFALSIAMLISYLLVAINISPIITLLAFIVGLSIFFIFKRFYYQNKLVSRKAENLYKQLAHYANESIIGAKTIKALAVERAIVEKGRRLSDELKELNIRAALIRIFTNVLIQPLGLIFAIAVFVFLYKWTLFNFASFVVIVYAINKIFLQIELLQTHIHCTISLFPYLMNIVKYQEEIAGKKELFGGGKNFNFEQVLEFKNVNFSYNDNKDELTGVSFAIKKGEFVGLIGPSGAGKTTLVDLSLRLLKPKSGQIFLDGLDIEEINLKEWRDKIGYVAQDSFLTNDTIENNIKFYNDNIKHEDVVAAAKMANICDFIEDLPHGFSTAVGERGLSLSGGQRQRIALARVLARKPQILILDEATSSLDNESEAAIHGAIENLRGEVTVLIIAHRLTTVLSSDRLLVLEKGKIIEEGKPDDLLKDRDSYFYKSYNLK